MYQFLTVDFRRSCKVFPGPVKLKVYRTECLVKTPPNFKDWYNMLLWLQWCRQYMLHSAVNYIVCNINARQMQYWCITLGKWLYRSLLNWSHLYEIEYFPNEDVEKTCNILYIFLPKCTIMDQIVILFQ